ncbi:MAG: hypothetical protein ACUVWO_17915, partial [Thermodesulfobacteriota bacterium]
MNRTDPMINTTPPSIFVNDRLLTGVTMGILLAILVFFLLYPVYDICKLSFYKEGVLSLKNYASYFSNPRMLRSLTNSLYVSIVTMIITTVL